MFQRSRLRKNFNKCCDVRLIQSLNRLFPSSSDFVIRTFSLALREQIHHEFMNDLTCGLCARRVATFHIFHWPRKTPKLFSHVERQSEATECHDFGAFDESLEYFRDCMTSVDAMDSSVSHVADEPFAINLTISTSVIIHSVPQYFVRKRYRLPRS